MQKIYRLLSLTLVAPALLLGILHGIRVQSPRQVVLRTAKSVAQALACVLAIASLAGSYLGWLARSPFSILVGLAGHLLSVQYVWRVQASARKVMRADLPPALHGQTAPEKTISGQPVATTSRPKWPRPDHSWRKAWLRDLPYAQPPGAAPLLCDLWLPPERITPSGTIIVYLHGGGFFTSSKDFGTRAFFRHLAGRGHAVMDADYRLAPGATLVEMQADARRSVHWIKTHAGEYGLQPQRIVLAGGSAGGLLALLVAYTPGHPLLTPPDLTDVDLRVQGVISYYAVVDLAGLYRRLAEVGPVDRKTILSQEGLAAPPIPARSIGAAFSQPRLLNAAARLGAWLKGVEPAAMRQYLLDNAALMEMGLEQAFTHLLSGAPGSAAQHTRLLSPAAHTGPHCPPTLLIHGEHDHLLPIAATRALAERLRYGGAQVASLELPQTEHTFDLFLPGLSPPALAAQAVVDRFLEWLAGT